MVVGTDSHEGHLKPQASPIVKVHPANVIVTGVKKAEDEDALIFRLLETDGNESLATISLDPQLLGKVSWAGEVDFIENPLTNPSGNTTVIDNGFGVKVPANGIASVKVHLTNSKRKAPGT